MSLFGKKETTEIGVGGEPRPRSKPGGKRVYGIAETTMLMRTLPVDQNVELVVRVVRSTLESMNVQLADIIDDAQAKELTLSGRVETLNGEISELSQQIDRRRQEIAQLQEELTETTTVKQRLVLAQKLGDQADRVASPERAPSALPPPPPFARVIAPKSAAELAR
jgi:TolA-binding protein